MYVEGLNIIKRHQRRASSEHARGADGRRDREGGPIHISNVMLIDPKDNKPTRIGVEIEDGKRFRVVEAHRNEAGLMADTAQI